MSWLVDAPVARWLGCLLALILGLLSPLHAVPPPVIPSIEARQPTTPDGELGPIVQVYLAAYRAHGPRDGRVGMDTSDPGCRADQAQVSWVLVVAVRCGIATGRCSTSALIVAIPLAGSVGFRAYDPAIGRWVSRDPLGEESSVNLYAYVNNNVYNAVDPLGLFSSLNTPAGAAALAAAQGARVAVSRAAMGAITTVQARMYMAAAWASGVTAGGGVLGAAIARFSRPAINIAQRGIAACRVPWASVPANVIANQLSRNLTQAHHAILRAFGGSEAFQSLVKLPDVLHRSFHSLLNSALLANGLPGASTSAETWQRLFASDPAIRTRALSVLLEASRAFDTRYGTNLVQEIWRGIMGWGL